MTFPNDFVWGAAAASYQIEGSTQGVDGCADSVWDMVCKQDGFVRDGDTGFVACDHYNRFESDIALMKQLGLKAYRLSIMWPRVMPEGTGQVNEAGLQFYDKLIDCLLAADIEPWVTIFHWDYPVALYNRGGWLNDDSSDWFADYTQLIVERFSDRVSHWITVNEPHCFIGQGHQLGFHAPGLKLPVRDVNHAWHNALLAHGKAVKVIREHAKKPPLIGAAPVFHSYIPATRNSNDINAARQQLFSVTDKNTVHATWWMDPVFKGQYPEDGLALFGHDGPPVKSGDLEIIHQPLDFMGYNLYQSTKVRADTDGQPELLEYPNYYPRTDFDWPVTPESLYWTSKFLYERYRKPIVVTENGLACNDWISLDGKIHDVDRIDFLNRYLLSLKDAIADGVEVLGYFQWSIMDNFEWAEGYAKRFGLIHVDFETQKRTIKESGYWYRDLIKSNGSLLGDASCLDNWPITK
jgi:beta-glucosidase